MFTSSYFNIIYYMLATDLRVLSRTVIDKIIDLLIWVISATAVTVYLLPSFGIEASYGAFLIVGSAASAGLFEQYSSATQLVSDFDGNRIISFYLTLPLPSWLVLIAYMLFYLINAFVLGFCVIPICKLLFWHHFSLANLSSIQYIVMIILASLFYATFTLWLGGTVASLERIGSAWMRFVYPLWVFGGYQYSYAVLAEKNPWFAYASLINPQLYIMEGMRAAVLGQEGYLNFWLCAGMTLFFSFICGAHAIIKIKRRLDFV